MEAARLHLVNKATGEVVEQPRDDRDYRISDLEDRNAGLVKTIELQARRIGNLERRIEEEEDPTSHPKGAEILALIERWKRGSGHPKAKTSADRVKLVKARLRDGYEISSEEWLPPEPTLELAVDGLCTFPYTVNGMRVKEGSASHRHDRLGIALGGGESVERFARMGYQARKDGLVTWAEDREAA